MARSRSTKAQKSRLLNAAHQLLARGEQLSEAAQRLSREFGLSRRQAYRYLEHAARLGRPVPVEEASVPITLKLPPSTVRQLRTYAARTAMTQGDVVTRALRAFLSTQRGHD
jgi:predicted DNA-binding transcriptional regulator YafY